MMRENLDKHVTGPVIELAAKVKKALEADPKCQIVKTDYGNFYISAIELKYYYGGDTELVGYLVPDEAEGDTFDFYTPKDYRHD